MRVRESEGEREKSRVAKHTHAHTHTAQFLLSLKDAVVQLDAHILSHALHVRLDIVLHAPTDADPLPRLSPQEPDVAAQQDDAKRHVADPIAPALEKRKVAVLGEGSRGPQTRDLDAVDGRAEELVVALDDAQVAADEEQVARPLGVVAQDLLDAGTHADLHLVGALLLVLALGRPAKLVHGGVVAARVGSHQGRAGEDVRRVDAPAADDVADRRIVQADEGLPEACVLVLEGRVHADVEAVVDEDELWLARGQPSHKDVTRVRVAVDDAPEEHLRREEVDHGGHDLLEGEAQPAFVVAALPGWRSVWLELLVERVATVERRRRGFG